MNDNDNEVIIDNAVVQSARPASNVLKMSLYAAGALVAAILLTGVVLTASKSHEQVDVTSFGGNIRGYIKPGVLLCNSAKRVDPSKTYTMRSVMPDGCIYFADPATQVEIIEAYSDGVVAVEMGSGEKKFVDGKFVTTQCNIADGAVLPIAAIRVKSCDQRIAETASEQQATTNDEATLSANTWAASYQATQARHAIVWRLLKSEGYMTPELLQEQRIWVAEKEGICGNQGGTSPGDQAFKRNRCLADAEEARLEVLTLLLSKLRAETATAAATPEEQQPFRFEQ
jgi:hypothetical protein